MEARVGVGMHGLHPCRIVDVRDGRNVGARHVELVDAEELLLLVGHAPTALLLHVGNEQHIGRIGIELEPVGHVLTQHGGRKRPEAFAKLDAQVERLLHGG